MFSNYLKIAWRIILRNKGYTLINLLGLAGGIACTLLIGLYIQDELSYDKFYTKADRLVRIVEDQKDQEGKVAYMATTYGALLPVLQTEFPDWEHLSRFYPVSPLVSWGTEKQFQEESFIYVDSTWLKMFDFAMLDGDPATALDAPFSIILTSSTAKRYFGNQSAIGQILTVRSDDGANDFKVTGVVDDVPTNSHLEFDFLAAYSSLRSTMPWVNNWHYPPMYTYALLPEHANIDQIQTQFETLPKKYLREDLANSRNFSMQAVTDIHLHSQRENEYTANGDITYVYMFAAIALFILLIACINFMNLATARSVKRAREVGMRKVLGAFRGQLIRQFLSESLLMSFLSLGLAVGVVALILPAFNTLAEKQLDLSVFSSWEFILIALSIIFIVGLLAGSYPAFYLSGFMPLKVMKGLGGNSGAAWLRKGLVVFQFIISCSLIVGTTVIYNQLEYIQNKKLGFEKEQLVLIPLRDEKDQINAEQLRPALLQYARILNASAASGFPTKEGFYGFPVTPKEARMDSLTMLVNFINDHDYLQTMGIELVEGRNFTENFSTDKTNAFIINEAAAKKLGWEKPVDKELTLTYHYQGRIIKTGRVIGVAKDFHFNSLHKEVDPIVMHISGGTYYNNFMAVRVSGEDLSGTIAFMEDKWRSFNPLRPFEYNFMDESFEALYRKEEQLGRVAGIFSMLAVLIACLGLFGLAAFTAEQRTREIGIRKVLGASIPQIISLLSIDFIKLVMVAFVLSVPLAYFFMDNWLSGFAYRIQLGTGIFLLAGTIAILIAFLTVSSQAYKAALTNPAESLRNE